MVLSEPHGSISANSAFFPPLPLRGFGLPLLLMLVTKLHLLLLGTLQLKELKPVFPLLRVIPFVKSALRAFP